MSYWLPSSPWQNITRQITNVTREVTNVTRDVFNEGTEEVTDIDAELQFAKVKIEELEQVKLSQKIEYDKLLISYRELEEKAHSEELHVISLSKELRSVIKQKDEEIKELKHENNELQENLSPSSTSGTTNHSVNNSHSNNMLNITNDDHDFDDVISSQHEINRLFTEVSALKAQLLYWKGLASKKVNSEAREDAAFNEDEIHILENEVKELNEQLIAEHDQHQHELSTLQDIHSQTIATLNKRYQTETAELEETIADQLLQLQHSTETIDDTDHTQLIQNYKVQLRESSDRALSLDSDLQMANDRIVHYENVNKQMQKHVEQCEQNVKEAEVLQGQVDGLQGQVDGLQGQVAGLHNQLFDYDVTRQRLAEMEQQMGSCEEIIKNLRRDVEKIHTQNNQKEREFEVKQRHLETENQELNHETEVLREIQESFKKELQSLEQERMKRRADLKDTCEALRRANDELSYLKNLMREDECEDRNERMLKLHNDLKCAEERNKELQTDRDQVREELFGARQRLFAHKEASSGGGTLSSGTASVEGPSFLRHQASQLINSVRDEQHQQLLTRVIETLDDENISLRDNNQSLTSQLDHMELSMIAAHDDNKLLEDEVRSLNIDIQKLRDQQIPPESPRISIRSNLNPDSTTLGNGAIVVDDIDSETESTEHQLCPEADNFTSGASNIDVGVTSQYSSSHIASGEFLDDEINHVTGGPLSPELQRNAQHYSSSQPSTSMSDVSSIEGNNDWWRCMKADVDILLSMAPPLESRELYNYNRELVKTLTTMCEQMEIADKRMMRMSSESDEDRDHGLEMEDRETQTMQQQQELVDEGETGELLIKYKHLQQRFVDLKSEMNNLEMLSTERVYKFDKLKSKEHHLEQELSRLRSHLLEVEDNYTREVIASEERENDLRNRLAVAEEKVLSSSANIKTATLQAQEKLSDTQEQLSFIMNERDTLLQQLSHTQEQLHQYASAVVNLQMVLEQFQREREVSIHLEVEKFETLLTNSKSESAELKNELIELQDRLIEASEELENASQLSEELEKRVAEITYLKEQVHHEKNTISSYEEKIHSLLMSADNKLDKSLVKNMFIGYFTSPRDKQREVLRLITGVLDFNSDELSKVGDSPSKKGWIGGWLGWSSGTQQQTTITAHDRSLADMFVEFVESESKPMHPPNLPKLPADQMAREQLQHHHSNLGDSPPTGIKPAFNPFTAAQFSNDVSSTTNQHLLMKPISSPLPTFTPVSPAGGQLDSVGVRMAPPHKDYPTTSAGKTTPKSDSVLRDILQ